MNRGVSVEGNVPLPNSNNFEKQFWDLVIHIDIR